MTVKFRYLLAFAVLLALVAVLVLRLQHSAPIKVQAPPPPAAQQATPPAAAIPAPATAAAPVDCTAPGLPPAMPDGATATKAQMTAAHDTIQAFVLQLEAYQTCRNGQADHASPLVTDAAKQAWINEGNDAVDQANALAAAYAAQIKIFHAKPGNPPAP